jgi:hypothetical protein
VKERDQVQLKQEGGKPMRNFLCIALVLLGFGVGVVAGFYSIDLKYWLYGPLHKSGRYSDVGGAFRGLIDGLCAVAIGGLIFARSGLLVAGVLSSSIWKRPIPLGKIGRGDLVLVVLALVWLYLVWASWVS